jgi:hypothetical protein
MKKKSSEKTKPNTKSVRFKVNIPKNERVSLAGDLNGCVLVIPESFGMNECILHNQWRLLEYPR